MGSLNKVLDAVLRGTSDRNIRFAELRRLLLAMNFSERISGDHYIYSRAGVVEIINIQPLKDGKAKAYQVKQVRELIEQYGLQSLR